MAQALLKARLESVAPDVHVHSCGLLEDGREATPDGVAVLAKRGIDLSGHRSRKITTELIRDADVIIGMSRRHVAEASVTVPDAWGKVFTLKELVRRGEEVGPRKAGQSMADWLVEVHWGRTRQDMLGSSREDDIADPIGKPRAVYEKTADEIDALLDRLVRLVWGKQ